jgi:hypothetical protein
MHHPKIQSFTDSPNFFANDPSFFLPCASSLAEADIIGLSSGEHCFITACYLDRLYLDEREFLVIGSTALQLEVLPIRSSCLQHVYTRLMLILLSFGVANCISTKGRGFFL